MTPFDLRKKISHSAKNATLEKLPQLFYCLNFTKFGQLILKKIIKIVSTSCQILRLKCIKFDFGWGSTPEGGEEEGRDCPLSEILNTPLVPHTF